MAGIKIDLVANVSKFIGGTKDVEKALSEVSGSLDAVAADATKLEGEFTDAFNTVKAKAREAGGAVGSEVKRGTKQAAEGLDDVKKEAAASARGMATSFRGGFEDISQFGQELLAQAFQGLGPAGAAAGIAAAVGIGLLVSQLQKAAEEANKTKQETVDLAKAIDDAGGSLAAIDWEARFKEFAYAIADSKEWWEVWQESAQTNLEKAAGYTDRFGLAFKDVFRGLGGDTLAANRALEAVNKQLAAQEAAAASAAAAQQPLTAAQADELAQLKQLRDELEKSNSQVAEAERLARLQANAIDDATSKEDDYAKAVRDSRKAVDAWNDAHDKKLAALRDEAGLSMSVAEANQGWVEAQIEAKDALKELNDSIDTSSAKTKAATDAVTANKGAWDLQTEAGRIANETTLSLAQSGWDLIESLQQSGAGAGELGSALDGARAELIKTAGQMGLSKDAAIALADKYLPLKGDLVATARLNTEPAKEELAKLWAQINGERWGTYNDLNNSRPSGGNTYNVNTTVNSTTTADPVDLSRQIAWTIKELP